MTRRSTKAALGKRGYNALFAKSGDQKISRRESPWRRKNKTSEVCTQPGDEYFPRSPRMFRPDRAGRSDRHRRRRLRDALCERRRLPRRRAAGHSRGDGPLFGDDDALRFRSRRPSLRLERSERGGLRRSAVRRSGRSAQPRKDRAAVSTILDRGATPIVLGGDYSVPIPVFQAFEGRGHFTVLQFDAHIDFRDEVGGERWVCRPHAPGVGNGLDRGII